MNTTKPATTNQTIFPGMRYVDAASAMDWRPLAITFANMVAGVRHSPRGMRPKKNKPGESRQAL